MATSASPSRSAHREGVARLPLTCNWKYLLALPLAYEKNARKRWPLVVFLHGSGERGESTRVLRKFGPAAQVERGRIFPFILLTPLCSEYESWNLTALDALITDISRRYRVDAERIYLTGLSMGGHAVWALAARNPGRYAAVVPICGEGEIGWAPRLKRLPIWVFHGVRDPVVPVQRSQEMVDAIRKIGGKPKLTLYPKVSHESWTPAYADESLYRWMLKQRRRRRRNDGT